MRDMKAMITLIFIFAWVGFSIAGEGGFVYLINLSGSDWKRTYQTSDDMEAWGFPTLLKNGDAELVYVEFAAYYFPFYTISSGRVDYELVGTGGKSFQISARYRRGLQAVYSNLEINGHSKGMVYDLGWRHDGDTNFVIIGKNGKYTGSGLDAFNWMKNNIEILGNRTLRQISIPGSHDAGMSRLDGQTGFVNECNVVTQSFSIGDQLNLGIRYFDIRPVIGNGGDYLTGHYTNTNSELGWQGGNGQSISSIVSDINTFTKDHNELIIIKLSHSLNTDIGSRDYRKFNQEEWEKLFRLFDEITYLYNNDNNNVKLDQITLNDYTNRGSRASVVIIVDDPDSKVQLGSRMGKGYFMPSSLDMYDDYAGKDDWRAMINDQIRKMSEHSNKQYFLLSWTMTQTTGDAIQCPVRGEFSVKALAYKANIQLGKLLYNEVSSSSYPNIILVDDVKDANAALMSLAISTKII